MKTRPTRWTSRFRSRRSLDPSWLRFPCSANAAPCGSLHRAIQTAARQFKRTLENLAAGGLHALRGRIDIADIEVEKPERNRVNRTFGEHAADRCSAGMEQLIDVRRTDIGARLPPAKKFAVKGKRLLQIGGEQLMPAHTSRFVRFGGSVGRRSAPRPAQALPFADRRRPKCGRYCCRSAGRTRCRQDA